MNREPSIHVYMNELFREIKPLCNSLDQYNEIKMIIIKLQRNSNLNNRNTYISSDKILKEVKKVTTSNISDVDMFNNLLHMIRKSKYKNNRINKIDKKSNQFTIIRKATELALEFCKEYQLDKKRGFQIYINKVIEVNKGKKFWLNNLVSKFDSVVDSYDVEIKLQNSEDSSLALDIEKIFLNKFEAITGMQWEDKNNVYHKLHYLEAAKICIDFGIEAKILVDSLFSFISEQGVDQFPSPGMLSSEKARHRLTKYLYKNNIKPKKTIQKRVSWDKIFDKNEEE